MRKLLSVIICLAVIFCTLPVCYAASGNTYYFDCENGDDSNSGTSENCAFKTLAKANSLTLNPGDSLLFKAGCIFNGNLLITTSGEKDNEIIVSSYGDTATMGKPIFRSDDDVTLLHILNASFINVSDIAFTAPNGKGLYIYATEGCVTTDVTVSDCYFSNIYYRECSYCNHYPISLVSSGKDARLENIAVTNCKIEKCAYGVNMGGTTVEWQDDIFVSPEESYNRNFLLDGLTLSDIYNDGIIICAVYGLLIRNCSLIDTSTSTDHYTAPMWSHHAKNYVIENCEIAGSTNYLDGMAVDFDGWTTDATYQYIYSHDNARFIRNCCYDNYTCNDNCTVRYCLSVNDNAYGNELAQMLTSGSMDYAEDEYAKYMTNFKFYNNTIINASSFKLSGLKDAVIANNIFVGDISTSFIDGRKSTDDNGKWVMNVFDGTITNNCFYGCGFPSEAKNNYITYPGFVSDNIDDKNSFMLTKDSNLLGKGIQVCDDMGEYDFYGNALTDVHNIGCYDGTGEDMEGVSISFFDRIKAFFGTILGTIYNFIDNCNNKYWLF